MNNEIKFGVAGFPVNFFSSQYGKKRENIFKWLNEIGLNVLELQCTYGIKMKEEQTKLYRDLSKEYHITLTVHAPYYINLASLNPDVAERSKQEIMKAYHLASILDAKRIIFHPGAGYGKTNLDRQTGLHRLIANLNEIKDCIDTNKIHLYPEVGGKINQLGNLDEIIQICKEVNYARPCIDLAHLHAREIGSMTSSDKIITSLLRIKDELGETYLKETHFHVYPVDYTKKGEKVHKAFGDRNKDTNKEYFPKAQDYIAAIKILDLSPITICEAHNTQDIGALLMKNLYFQNK